MWLYHTVYSPNRSSSKHCMEVINFWFCWVVKEPHVVFNSSSLLGPGSHRLLDRTSYTLHEAPVFWSPWWFFGIFGSPAEKWNQFLHKPCQHREARNALKFPGRRLNRWTTTIRWWRHHSPICDSHPKLCDLDFLIENFTFTWKEEFGPMSNSPVLCSSHQRYKCCL